MNEEELCERIFQLEKELKEEKEKSDRYYFKWKHLEANIINKIQELEQDMVCKATRSILKELLEE